MNMMDGQLTGTEYTNMNKKEGMKNLISKFNKFLRF
jgi:hypothetical protein